MTSRINFSFAGMVMAGFFVVFFSFQSPAQAVEDLTSSQKEIIQSLINDAKKTGDTDALATELTRLTTAFPELAKAIAVFASTHIPRELPSCTPEEFDKQSVVNMLTSIISGHGKGFEAVTKEVEDNENNCLGSCKPGEVEEDLVVAMLSAIIVGAPKEAGLVADVFESVHGQCSESISEAALLAGFTTAGGPPGDPPPPPPVCVTCPPPGASPTT
ncbi:MAG TPA: hypothetical protein ENI79_03820 [Rhodospirillales bacterium]|nr:hypothetical protein [Rhodospirillales bacterium]